MAHGAEEVPTPVKALSSAFVMVEDMKSFFSALQFRNMEDDDVTFDKSNLLRSSSVSAEHPLNMSLMFVVLDVFRAPMLVIFVKMVIPVNHWYVVVGLAASNDASKATSVTDALFALQPGLAVPVFRLYLLPDLFHGKASWKNDSLVPDRKA